MFLCMSFDHVWTQNYWAYPCLSWQLLELNAALKFQIRGLLGHKRNDWTLAVLCRGLSEDFYMSITITIFLCCRDGRMLFDYLADKHGVRICHKIKLNAILPCFKCSMSVVYDRENLPSTWELNILCKHRSIFKQYWWKGYSGLLRLCP